MVRLLDAVLLASLRALAVEDRICTAETASALRRIDSSINQLQGLRLTMIAAAVRSQVGKADGLVDAGAWIARESRLGGAEASRSGQLASSLGALAHAGDALADGFISVKHVEVIAAATKNLPADSHPLSAIGWKPC